MIVKMTGRSTSPNSTVSYLGTTNDKTPAHQNPGKQKFNEYRKLYNQTHLAKYRQMMDKYKVFIHRDLATGGNFDTSSERTISRSIAKFMSRNNRKIQTRQFIFMPSDKDDISPNDPDGVYRFEKFVQSYVDNHFVSNSRKHPAYFHYYWVIQADSHQHSRIHAHLVVVNDNLRTGRAMSGRFYNIASLRTDLEKTVKEYNQHYPNRQFSIPSKYLKEHDPSQMETRIINKAQKAFKNLKRNPDIAKTITSIPKMKRYLAEYGIKADYRRTRKTYHKKHYYVRGWKFKLNKGRHAYIKASRISLANNNKIDGSFLSTKNIDKQLTHDRRIPKMMRQAQKSASVESSSVSRPTRSQSTVSSSYEDYEPSLTTSVSSSSSSVDSSALRASSADSVASVEAFRHSMATVSEINSVDDRYSSEYANSLSSYKSDYINASMAQPNPAWKKILNGSSLKYREELKQHRHDIRKRYGSKVNNLLGKFHSRKSQRYAGWRYNNAIPAEVIGYDSNIPVFAMNRKDRSLLHKLERPIVKDLKNAGKWARDKYEAGKKAVTGFMNRHGIPMGIHEMIDAHGMYDPFNNTHTAHDVYIPYSLTQLAKQSHHFFGAVKRDVKRFSHSLSDIRYKFDDYVNEKDTYLSPVKQYHYAKKSSFTFSNSKECTMSLASFGYYRTMTREISLANEETNSLYSSENKWQSNHAIFDSPLGSKAMNTVTYHYSDASSMVSSLAHNSSAKSRYGYDTAMSILTTKPSLASSSNSTSHQIHRDIERGPEM